ncbi:phosphate regulon sensor kinase PhoR [Streptomyces davaonensis JCM 4913]|uniref:histidine kinase n=1 Tax=Streptomyces davaonensis (strain DSM 101723 / JCM 4913 / KCC S-0913 / 768) TaxID=1214101 RepID=K4QV51_STRDJ|nr:HAMP domain-containing sensor histidine kinase [Streptomyces davaonensis]CCK27936.1 phosphate regulon sensor kinase PhoR [Streptomyces davaonensis JCM 4913]
MRLRCLGRGHRGIHSLRAKLTMANVALLALGIVAATAISLMAARHYLLDKIDSELLATRSALQTAGFSMSQIESLSELGIAMDQFTGADAKALPSSNGSVFVAVDAKGSPVSLGPLKPTKRQRAVAEAAGHSGDPATLASLAAEAEPRDIRVDDSPYRIIGARLSDGTLVLIATSTDALHEGMAKAIKLDLAFGTVLLALLACLTLISVSRRMRPLEDMVETSSAIAEGDLTRRVPSSREATLEVEQLRLALNSMLHQVELAHRTREHSSAQLRRFVADASHELRTPLAAIRGYLQLYDKGMLNDPDQRKRAWERVMTEADRMGRLVDELLCLARLDQQPELRFRNVDVSRLVRDAAEDLRVQQPDRPVTVTAEGAVLLRADESGLRQVLGNLVTNVRTHTPADAPVHLEVRRQDGVVRLCVADEGPGLAEEDAARVFDRFFRAGGGAGSGLGMAIVQGVVKAHGGVVRVDTAPGEGLKVTVTLPT